MPETAPNVSNQPTTHYMWSTYTPEGIYSPRSQPGPSERSEANAAAAAAIDVYRDGLRDRLLADMEGVPPLDNVNVERIDHYFKALGLPTAPLVTARGVDDLPQNEFSQVFRDMPALVGHNFQLPRVVMVVGRPEFGDLSERTAVHEKAHSTGQQTIAIDNSGPDKTNICIVRHGLGAQRPVDQNNVDKIRAGGDGLEEAQAELWAGIYDELFLRGQTPPGHLQGWQVPGRHKLNEKGSMSTAASAAVGLELLAERDARLPAAIIASRLSVDGLRYFIRIINGISPGLYKALFRIGHDDHLGILTEVRDRLQLPDEDASVHIKDRVKAFVVQKLQAYEQRTGYNFNLPSHAVPRSTTLTTSVPGVSVSTDNVVSIYSLKQNIAYAVGELPVDVLPAVAAELGIAAAALRALLERSTNPITPAWMGAIARGALHLELATASLVTSIHHLKRYSNGL